jgi:hypothetical protein
VTTSDSSSWMYTCTLDLMHTVCMHCVNSLEWMGRDSLRMLRFLSKAKCALLYVTFTWTWRHLCRVGPVTFSRTWINLLRMGVLLCVMFTRTLRNLCRVGEGHCSTCISFWLRGVVTTDTYQTLTMRDDLSPKSLWINNVKLKKSVHMWPNLLSVAGLLAKLAQMNC